MRWRACERPGRVQSVYWRGDPHKGVPAMRLRVTAVVFLSLFGAFVAAAAEFDPFAGPKPPVVFIQTEPRAMVIGADTPRVAIYEDGEAIFTKAEKNRLVYHHAKLDAAPLAAVR